MSTATTKQLNEDRMTVRDYPLSRPVMQPVRLEPIGTSVSPDCAKLAVSPDEGARLAGIGRTKFYEAISTGQLKSAKVGRRRLVRVAEIDAWIKRLELRDM